MQARRPASGPKEILTAQKRYEIACVLPRMMQNPHVAANADYGKLLRAILKAKLPCLQKKEFFVAPANAYAHLHPSIAASISSSSVAGVAIPMDKSGCIEVGGVKYNRIAVVWFWPTHCVVQHYRISALRNGASKVAAPDRDSLDIARILMGLASSSPPAPITIAS